MRKPIAVMAAAATLVAGCGSSGSGSASKPPSGTSAQGPRLVATGPPGHPRNVRFVDRVDNPWFPLKPGTTLVYRGIKDGKPSRDVFTVMPGKVTIDGVQTTPVSDLLYLRGRLEERTSDWYAQDTAGNVWYFGERTAELNQDGSVKTTSGTWKAGFNGAQAGIFMPGNPRVGQSGRQEYYRGQADDHYRVKSLSASVHTPGASSSKQALLTEERTPLEPGVLDHKLYVRGIGTVLEQTVKGGDERNTLVSVKRG